MSEWKQAPLGELAETQLGKMLDQKKNVGDYRRYLGNDNVQWNYFKLTEVKEMRFKDSELERFRLRSGDLLVCEGGDPGRCALWESDDEFYFQKALHRVRVGKELDSRFLLYYLLHIGKTKEIQQYYTGGATIKHLPAAALNRVVVRYPSLAVQRRIAGILLAYDKLIENSRRQIALLEEAAQRLYKEWFVDLRFPGYETTPIIDGLPEGWRKVALESFIESHIGGGWGSETSTSDFNVEAFVVRATDISNISNGNLSLPLRWHKESNFRTRSLTEGDIVFEVSGGSKEIGVGRSMIVSKQFLKALDRPVICASFCKKVRCRSVSDAYLLYEQIQMDLTAGGIRKYEKRSAGNIINFHWEDFLKSYQVIVPDDDTLKLFSIQISCIRKQAENCKMLCMLAKEARDRLLPKLMSGEIEVV